MTQKIFQALNGFMNEVSPCPSTPAWRTKKWTTSLKTWWSSARPGKDNHSLMWRINISPQRHRVHREVIFDLMGRYPSNQNLLCFQERDPITYESGFGHSAGRNGVYDPIAVPSLTGLDHKNSLSVSSVPPWWTILWKKQGFKEFKFGVKLLTSLGQPWQTLKEFLTSSFRQLAWFCWRRCLLSPHSW